MTTLYGLAIQTLMISPSGALSPGPLTFAAMALGVDGGWKRGLYVALGHMSFELQYIALLALAMNTIRDLLSGFIGDVVAVAGSGVVLFFASLLIRDSIRGSSNSFKNRSINGVANAFITGFLFTSLNVFFLLWWLSVGFSLILTALELGFTGLLTMFLAHIWMDFLWLSLVAEAGKRGRILLGGKGYRVMLAVFGILLLFFGINTVLKRFLSISLL
ncbi:MAG: LysE family translocator [Ignisphaera sp.]|nr:LysE family translocator [Ignisphaera sp.]MCX8167764.1 LysE family translocator [Ignisphaera sp.]MDW8085249.1 LysE family transporter [Ignisphaera sp.]